MQNSEKKMSALDKLKEDHLQISEHLQRLSQFAQIINSGSVGLQQVTEGITLQRFFAREQTTHQRNEEQHLFPQLQRQSLKLADRVHQALKQHQQLNELWQVISPGLARPNNITEIGNFISTVTEFIRLKQDHLQFEDEDILDIAQHIFSQDELEKMLQQMIEQQRKRPNLRIQ